MATISLSVTQNFLKESTIDKVFEEYVKIPEDMQVVDIGAGTGNITTWLTKHTKNQILAYELDTLLFAELRSRFGPSNKVTILNKNFLQSDDLTVNFCVVANIPFMITTALIKHITNDLHFQEGYLVLQKEAAYRFGGAELKKPSGILSTLLNVDFSFEILHTFTSKDFMPAPQVTSVLLHIKRKPEAAKFQRRTEFADFVAYLFNKSLPEIRRAPLLGRYLARKIDLGRIPLMQKKPSELSLEDITYLFSLCDYEILEKIAGYDEMIKEQGESVQKIYRTRNAEDWKDRDNY